jgi:hypothetical protein
MHDPMHVVFSIRRPPLSRPRRPFEHDPLPAFAFWRLRPGDLVPHRWWRRVMFSGAFFRVGRRWEWFLPAVVTVWHRDPESDGTDSSCRNAVRARRQAAIKEHRYLAAAWWDWYWRRYDWFHVHHWTVQFDAAQQLRRWALTRCETCGGRQTRGRPVNFHVVVDRDAEDRRRGKRSFRERWLIGERNLHHHDCSALASLRATKASLPIWLKQWGRDEWCMANQRKQEPYYGCYAWWRELILGEPPEIAAALAAAHVQRRANPCPDCDGTGHPVARREAGPPVAIVYLERTMCPRCEGTGHERVEHPVPAELV